MAEALQQAHRALPADVPVGAVILAPDGTRLAAACNRRERDHDPTAHAEMRALTEAGKKLGNWRLSETTLVVTLEPCPMCASAIRQARVKRVVFGAYDPVMGACGSALNLMADAPDLEVIGGIQEEACRQLLLDFFHDPARRGP
jgi:tRNA(adenine34) deaminase